VSVYRLTLAQLRGRIERAGGSMADATIRQAMPVLKVLAVAGYKQHFQRQAGPDGRPWAQLARPRVSGGGMILTDLGRLAAAGKAESDGNTLVLKVSHPAARVHQFGADIKPKKGKYLTIPLTKEAKRVGSPRQNHFPRPLFVVEVDGVPYLCENKSSGRGRKKTETLVFQYMLVKGVRIPQRLFVGFSRETLGKIDRAVADTAADNAVALFEPKSADWSRIF
jgi:phage gpG-like protein